MNGIANDSDIATAMRLSSDPWTAVISWLIDAADGSRATGQSIRSVPSIRRDASGTSRRRIAAEREKTPVKNVKTASITVVERFNATSVSITWRDATAENYCEQLWIRRISRTEGICVLTGSVVVPGDAIYSPAGRSACRLTNGAQMALAVALERIA